MQIQHNTWLPKYLILLVCFYIFLVYFQYFNVTHCIAQELLISYFLQNTSKIYKLKLYLAMLIILQLKF